MPLLHKLPFAMFLGCASCLLLSGQALPTQTAPTPYTGFGLPTVGGTLRYSVTAAETVVTGYNGYNNQGANAYTSFSGNLAYLSRSEHHPFSAVYSGGYLIGNSSFPSYPFQSLTVSQVLQARRWTFVAADSVSYMPQTPISGLSGVPGVGDVGLQPVQTGPDTGLGILTQYATRVTNTVSGTATRDLTGSTSLSVTGSYLIQRYTGNSNTGINNNTATAAMSLRHRLNGRSSLSGSYVFTNNLIDYSAIGTQGTYQTHNAVASYSRQLTRKVSLFVGAGPQWIIPGRGSLITSSSLSYTANAGLNYAGKLYGLALAYSRGINNGNGVVVGSQYDTISFTAQRTFARIFNASGLLGYNRSASITNSALANYDSTGVVASAQVSAQVRPSISTFASYSLQRQLFNGASPSGIAFNGLSNYISFGVTYSPKAIFDRK